MATRKTRLNPMKLQCLLLYGSYSFVEYHGQGRLSFPIGQFARLLRVKNSHLKEYLEWLEERQLIESLEFSSAPYASASCTVRCPPLFLSKGEQ